MSDIFDHEVYTWESFSDQWFRDSEPHYVLFNKDGTVHECKNKSKFEPNFNNEEEKMSTQTHLVELLLENFYTIGVRYDGSSKIYTFKVAKSIVLEVDDQVIVFTSGTYNIATVARVDDGINIDVTSGYKYRFIVQKLDTTLYDELNETDNKVAKALAQVQTIKARKELLETFVGTLGEEQIKLLENECGIDVRKRL